MPVPVLAAVAAAVLAASPAAPTTRVLDDYPGALAKARALQRPLLVDVWAPW